MDIKTAIEKAKENGYKDPSAFAAQEDLEWLLAVIDPNFWEALGKALGWENKFKNPLWPVRSAWELMWHLFINHLANGKDPESFFTSL